MGSRVTMLTLYNFWGLLFIACGGGYLNLTVSFRLLLLIGLTACKLVTVVLFFGLGLFSIKQLYHLGLSLRSLHTLRVK